MAKPHREIRGRQPASSKQRGPQAGQGAHLPIYLSRTILVLACLIQFLPLVVSYDFYSPYIFSKSILFRLAVQAMTLLYVLLAVMSPKHRPRLHRITGALLAYFGVMLLCSLPGISTNAWNSWWGDFLRMGGMFTQLHLLAYFLVLTQTLKEERDWLAPFAALLFSGVLMGLTGLIQYLHLEYLYNFAPQIPPRICGAAGNAGFYGTYMMLNFLVVFWLLSRPDKEKTYVVLAKFWILLLLSLDIFLVIWEFVPGGSNPGILGAGLTLLPVAFFAVILHAASALWFLRRHSVPAGNIFLSILALYYLYWMNQSQTRATMVGLVGALSFISLFYFWGGASKRTKWAAAGLIFLVVLLPPIVWLNRESPWMLRQPTLVRLTSTSFFEGRISAWKAGALGMLDRPLLGWGPENFKNAFELHFPARVFLHGDAEVWFDRAHNLMVEIGTTTGLLGLAAFLGFYALALNSVLRRWIRTKDVTNSLPLAALLLAYLLQNLFTFDTLNTDVIVFLALAYIAHLHGREELDLSGTADLRPGRTAISWQGCLAVAAASAILAPGYRYLVKGPYESNILLNQAITLEKEPDPQSGMQHYVFREDIPDLFQRANDYQTTGRYEVREQFANYASNLAQAAYVPAEEKVRMVKRALAFLEESIAQEPNNARRYMYPASLVNNAFDVLEQSDPALARSLAERSVVLMQKAESLCPTNPQTHLDLAKLFIRLGRLKDAIPALEMATSLNPAAKEQHMDLVALCIFAGRYDDAARGWQRMKELSIPLTSEDYDSVIELYKSRKQFGPVITLIREQLERTPNDAHLMTHLVSAYLDLRDIESARKTALKASAMSPKVTAELRNLMDSMNK